MKNIIKNNLRLIYTFAAPPPPPSVPLDAGISMLVVVAIGYGAQKMINNSEKDKL
jgi:hypothetical protein